MYMLVYYNLVLVVKEQLTLKVLPKERITTAQIRCDNFLLGTIYFYVVKEQKYQSVLLIYYSSWFLIFIVESYKNVILSKCISMGVYRQLGFRR